MRRVIARPPVLKGTVTPPGDKSVSHRALLLNSIARGRARVSGLSSGTDVLSTLGCLRSLGVEITAGENEGSWVVQGLSGELTEPKDVLDAGNSGTSMRLLSGLLSGQPFLSVLSGDDSLRSRPMGRVIEPLKLMGAGIAGRANDTLAPLAIRGGSLKGIEYTMPVASAQVKSSVILAGLAAEGRTVLRQPARSRDHTERMVSAMEGRIRIDGLTLEMEPGPLAAVDVRVPGDISSAAFWIVAALCHPNARVNVSGVGVNPTRAGILTALETMGARITRRNPRTEGGEPVADLLVESSELTCIDVGGDMVPLIIDELPVLAVAACFASGTTNVRDAQELRVKESDRISTTVKELSALGARIEERPDGMVVEGTGCLAGSAVQSHGDHRLAMALAVAGLVSQGDTIVEGAEAADVSYPQFWDHLQALSGEAEIRAPAVETTP